MRKAVPLFLVVLLASTNVAAIELPEWSWRGGFFGDPTEGDVFSDEPGHPGYACVACRDPEEFPVDFAAFAYNGYLGENPWMFESQLGIPFRVYNLEMQWVVVWFEKLLFDSPTLLPDTVEVHLRLPTGEIIVVTVLQSGPDLQVGISDAPADTEPVSCSCGGTGGGGDDGDYADPDDYEPPEIEPMDGVVEILDPDENGDFPGWEEEEL